MSCLRNESVFPLTTPGSARQPAARPAASPGREEEEAGGRLKVPVVAAFDENAWPDGGRMGNVRRESHAQQSLSKFRNKHFW